MLEACPVCRTTLLSQVQRCPDCGTDLSPFIERQQLCSQLVSMARQLISQGETQRAERILPQLSQLDAIPPAIVRELHARLALRKGDSASAEQLARQIGGAVETELLEQCEQLNAARRQARELYNSALWQARQGAYPAAAEELASAVLLDPTDPRIWQLKLKLELKARLYSRCYASLAALDRLHARPLEFARLEALLPATAQAA
jgi:uncharacterized protein HemY